MEDYKYRLVRLKTRLLTASSEIWDMVKYDEAKSNIDIAISLVVVLLLMISIRIFGYYPKINNPYAEECFFYGSTIAFYIILRAIIVCCRVFRFLHCLAFGGGWSVLAATEPLNLGTHEPLINGDILV